MVALAITNKGLLLEELLDMVSCSDDLTLFLELNHNRDLEHHPKHFQELHHSFRELLYHHQQVRQVRDL